MIRPATILLLGLGLTACGKELPTKPRRNLAGRTFECYVATDRVAHVQPGSEMPVDFPARWHVTIRFDEDGTYRYTWASVGREPVVEGEAAGTWRGRPTRGGTVKFWYLTEEGEEPADVEPPREIGVAWTAPWPYVIWMKNFRRWELPAIAYATGRFLDHQPSALGFLDE